MWIILRASVGARLHPLPALALDFGVILMGWGLFLFLTARPLVSAVVITGLAIGLIVVDQVKRAVLKEPVVFADRAELWEIVRHPQLYLPFAGTGRVLGGAAVIVIGFVTLLFLEPPLWPLSPLPPLFGIIVVLALMLLPGRQALLPHLARVYTNWAPSRDPTSDAKRFGLLASFVIHATLARAERQQRRAGLAPARQTHPAAAGTIVLVQSESFFDAARLDPALADRVLPEFSALRSTASLTGRLDVPCWGANTIRTEFAVLTGVEESRLGLDRFNPYEAFARTPIESLAWRARAAGWRTICVHPFDLRFYGRNHVLPMLGFETLIGQEAFKGADHYVADIDLAQRVATELDEVTGGVLILVITMEGHGPWDAGSPADTIALPPALAEVPEHVALSRYLFRQKSADRAIPILTEALRRRLGRGVLALYGDHQPSLPKAFAAISLADTRTDYVIWRSDIPGNGEWRDMPAHLLGQAIGEAVGLT